MKPYLLLFAFCVVLLSIVSFETIKSQGNVGQSLVPQYLAMVRERAICSTTALLDAVTGSLFTMDKKRSYSGQLLKDAEDI